MTTAQRFFLLLVAAVLAAIAGGFQTTNGKAVRVSSPATVELPAPRG